MNGNIAFRMTFGTTVALSDGGVKAMTESCPY